MGLITVLMLDKRATSEHLGIIPYMLNPDDPRPAREQFDAEYQHGGGWRPLRGFTMGDDYTMQYGDPNEEDADEPLHPIAKIEFREETILFYPYGWVAVVQPDLSFEMCRMD